MLLAVGRGMLTVTSKLNYWPRLRAFASIKFGETYTKMSVPRIAYKGNKQSSAFSKFLGSKYASIGGGLTASEIAYQAVSWLIDGDEKISKANGIIDQVAVISTNYMSDTFVKYVEMLITEDVGLKEKLALWEVKLLVVAGASDKSFRLYIQPKHGEVKILSSFCVVEWINKVKGDKGDLKRLSDVFEYEYFHSSHNRDNKDKGARFTRLSQAYRDNILISDTIDINKIKAIMAYSAILYDLSNLESKSKSLDTTKLPTVKELDREVLSVALDLHDDKFVEKALASLRVKTIVGSKGTDIAGAPRISNIKDNILNAVANTDYQDAAVFYVKHMLISYMKNYNIVIFPTKFKSSDFDENAVRAQDNYRAFIISNSDDLDKLGDLLMDGRSKIGGNPGMVAAKVKKLKNFANKASIAVEKLKNTANDKALTNLLHSLTTGGNE